MQFHKMQFAERKVTSDCMGMRQKRVRSLLDAFLKGRKSANEDCNDFEINYAISEIMNKKKIKNL